MKKNGWKGFCKKLYKYRVFLLMLAPAVIYTLIFSYYPMTGIVMAFKKFVQRDLLHRVCIAVDQLRAQGAAALPGTAEVKKHPRDHQNNSGEQ